MPKPSSTGSASPVGCDLVAPDATAVPDEAEAGRSTPNGSSSASRFSSSAGVLYGIGIIECFYHSLLFYFVTMLIVVVVAYLDVLKDGNGVVGQGGQREVLGQ